MAIDDLVKQGIAICKAGRRTEARVLLEQAIAQDEYNTTAWLWLSGAVDTDEDRRICLENVLTIDPGNAFAQRGLAMLDKAAPPPGPAAQAEVRTSTATAPYAEPRQRAPAEREPQVIYEPAGAPATHEIYVEPKPQPAPEVGPTPVAASQTETPQERKQSGSQALLWVLGIVGGLLAVGVVLLVVYVVLNPEALRPAPVGDPREQILAVIRENVDAHNAEDIERYMETIGTFGPSRLLMRNALEEMYQTYDLHAQLYGVQILEMTDRQARVSFILTTRKIKGPEFRDNKVEGVFIVRKQGRHWKIADQEIADITYLN